MKKLFDKKMAFSAAVGSVFATLILMPIAAPLYATMRTKFAA